MNRNERFEIDTTPSSKTGLAGHWDWLLVLSIAWLLFDLFAEPMLSIVCASIKFGWNDFANGFWLWRRDPVRRRARTCGVFYSAAGFWRITVMTFLIMLVGLFVIGVVGAWQADNGVKQDDEPARMATGLSFMIVCLCFVASSVTTWLAMILGWRSSQKVWLDPSVRLSRRQKEWPPAPVGKNQLSRVVTSSLVFLCVISLILSVVLLVQMADLAGGPGFTVLAPVASIIFSGFVILGGRNRILTAMSARAPEECWSIDS